jgi:hypothetical protein
MPWRRMLVGELILGIAATVIAAPSAGRMDTSAWKTYRSESLRFEVRYPKDWHVRLSNDGDRLICPLGPTRGTAL